MRFHIVALLAMVAGIAASLPLPQTDPSDTVSLGMKQIANLETTRQKCERVMRGGWKDPVEYYQVMRSGHCRGHTR